MAKKKVGDETPTDGDFVDRVFAEVEGRYGSGVLVGGEGLTDRKRTFISLGPSLDVVTSGGIEEGTFVGLTGNNGSGKTAVALSFAATCQRPENGARPVFYAKVEGRLPLAVLRGTKGLLTTRPHFNVIQSTPGRVLTMQDYLAILLGIIKTVPNAVVIIDSISALCDEREMADGVGTETRGGGAKLFSQFCRLAGNVVSVNNTIVVGITHLISNTSGMGAQYVERAARAWGYQCSYQLRIQTKSAWKVGERQVGFVVRWVANKANQGPPGVSMDSYIRFGVGVDRLYEAVVIAMGAGLIKKKGSWLSLDFLADGGDPPQVQGAENVYRALSENPGWAERLYGAVAGVGSALASAGED